MNKLPDLIAKGRAEWEEIVECKHVSTAVDPRLISEYDIPPFLEAYATEVWNAALDAGLEALPIEKKEPEEYERVNLATGQPLKHLDVFGFNVAVEEVRTNLQALKQ